MPAILLVSADSAAITALSPVLREAGHSVLSARDGLHALRVLYENPADAAVISTPVERIEAVELVRLLRALSGMPILLMLPSSNSALAVRLLDAGADDVIPTSIRPEELLARLRALSRRVLRSAEAQVEQSIIQTGSIVIDRTNREVTKRGVRVSLSQTEYKLLDALASRVGHVAPHRFLLSTVWGDAFVDDTHYLRMYVGYLRAKLEDDPVHPLYLKNEWGSGYRLVSLPVSSEIQTMIDEVTPVEPMGLERSDQRAESESVSTDEITR